MKTRLLLAFLLSIVAGLQSMKAQEAYAVYTEDNTTLTFYYDNQRYSRAGETYSLLVDSEYQEWYLYESYTSVTQVVFDSSFANARPTTTNSWFYLMENLQSITGMEYLNTSEVTDMEWMFYGCKNLISLDLSHFNTEKVTTMRKMFADCMRLENLNVSSFNTTVVTDMLGMFDGCIALKSLDLSTFNTANVTNMSNMFNYCNLLETIYVGNGWSTAKVTSSLRMFYNCAFLVGGAGTTYSSNHTDASYAHIDGGTSNPGYLTAKTIDVWIAGTRVTPENRNNVLGDGTVSFDMGSNTLTLKNANITADEAYGLRSKTPLNIKLEGENSISVVWKSAVFFQKGSTNGTVTILGDGSLDVTSDNTPIIAQLDLVIKDGAKIKLESTGDYTGINGLSDGTQLPTLTLQGTGTELRAKGGSPGSLTDFRALNLSDGIEIQEPAGATFTPNVGVVKNGALVANQWVVIAGPEIEAYAVYTSGNTTLTFYYDNQRSSRTGTTYDLNEDATDTTWETDGTNANVTKVVFDPSFADARPTTTYSWFWDMKQLQTITGMEYLNTSEVTNMAYMFGNCQVLTGLDVSKFNTAKVKDMSGMFGACNKLTSLDLSSFNTAKVTDMSTMFMYCYDLSTIYVGNDWNTAAVTSSINMFKYCTSLVGGQGTAYDVNHIDASYAHFDDCVNNPGYFTDKNAPVTYFMVDGMYYKVIGANMVGVTYKAGYNTYRGMVEIPENVTFRDVTYAVKTIEDKAFYDCQNLSYLTIPSSVEIIGAQAFHNCTALHTIVCYALNPPQLQYNSFDEEQYERVNVYVDLDYVLDYIYALFWENFYVDTIDAIEDVNANVNLNDSWFDLQGRKIGKARKGIYIKDGRKVLIK